MFVNKRELIAMHEREFEAWEKLLDGLSTAQTINPLLPDGLSVKDTVAHLGAWQARTIARLEAALRGHEPQFPLWPVEVDEEESSDIVDRANSWIMAANRDRSWADIYEGWRADFLHFLDLLREIPEPELRPGGTFAWAAEYQPLDGYEGLYDYHHAEHRGPLEDWIRGQANP